MKAAEVKASILSHALYRLHFVAAITESGHGCAGIADVLGILESGYTVEFEVKTSKADLMGELKSIAALVQKVDLFADPSKKVNVAKYPKHNSYLNNTGMYSHMLELEMRPNKFFFAVPEALEEIAKKGLVGTPYGLYSVDSYGNAACKKRGDLLHDRKASERLRLKILNRYPLTTKL